MPFKDPNKEKEYRREYSKRNSHKAVERATKWASENKDRRLKNVAKWREKNREEIRRKHKEWRDRNPDKMKAQSKKIGEYYKKRIKTDIEFKLKHLLRRHTSRILKNGIKKSKKTLELLGCSVSEFKLHLESLFVPGMSWENRSLWHIDHKRPCDSFDLTDEEQQKACFHYTNLQPLWATENLQKSNK